MVHLALLDGLTGPLVQGFQTVHKKSNLKLEKVSLKVCSAHNHPSSKILD
jgi:metallophosphoesterase superfamily enzyme